MKKCKTTALPLELLNHSYSNVRHTLAKWDRKATEKPEKNKKRLYNEAYKAHDKKQNKRQSPKQSLVLLNEYIKAR